MGKIIFKLDEILKKQDKTIYWLSQQTGISHNNLTKMVRNETNSVRFDKLVDIMDALDLNIISDVIEYKNDVQL